MGYVCRFLIVLVVLGNSGQLQAGQEVSLPDYQRESRIIYQGLCDRGSVNYKTYWKKGGYVLEVAVTDAQDVFYMLKRHMGGNLGWHERYFIRLHDSAIVTEADHDEWDDKIKQTSINYLNKLHDLETTCSRVLVM